MRQVSKHQGRSARSDHYQYLLIEVPCDNQFLSQFNRSQSLGCQFNPFIYNEKVLELKDQLINRLWEAIELKCTEIQKTVIKLYHIDGYTQPEIAKIRNCAQSSVIKTLIGNSHDYHSKGLRGNQPTPRLYGGAYTKLRKFLSKDKIFQNLLKQIKDLQEELS